MPLREQLMNLRRGPLPGRGTVHVVVPDGLSVGFRGLLENEVGLGDCGPEHLNSGVVGVGAVKLGVARQNIP